MTELDDLLRASLHRLAEPGDPSGVLDAIRAKLGAAGPAGSGGAEAGGLPGFAGPAIITVIALAGTAIGTSVALLGGAPTDESAPPAPSAAELPYRGGVPAAACPGGAPIAELDGGARVLALATSDDGAFLAVRNPEALGTLVWIDAHAAIVDPGQDVGALEVKSCDEGEALPPSPEPVPSPDPAPQPEPPPDPQPNPNPNPQPNPTPVDQTPPTLQVGSWNLAWFCHTASAYGPYSASISVTVGDNVGVTSVTASTSSAGVSISGPTGGSTKTFTISRTGTTGGNVSLTFDVRDAAGNSTTGSSGTILSYPECIG